MSGRLGLQRLDVPAKERSPSAAFESRGNEGIRSGPRTMRRPRVEDLKAFPGVLEKRIPHPRAPSGRGPTQPQDAGADMPDLQGTSPSSRKCPKYLNWYSCTLESEGRQAPPHL
jgi:hypothetical protein